MTGAARDFHAPWAGGPAWRSNGAWYTSGGTSMSQEHELYAAIVTEPDDAALRRALAAYCDGRGDPRGELIRTQLEIDRPAFANVLVSRYGERPWLANPANPDAWPLPRDAYR